MRTAHRGRQALWPKWRGKELPKLFASPSLYFIGRQRILVQVAMKQKHKKPCYYCGSQANSDEHAPPRQMFKGFSCDSITVPSCSTHNSEKGGADQAIVSAFLIPLFNTID